MSKKENDKELSRRDFIKTTGATTAGLVATSLVAGKGNEARAAKRSLPTSAKILGANDRIRYGMISVGGMGGGHLNILKGFSEKGEENIEVIAACDVYEKRRLKAQDALKLPEGQAYKDYRHLLENKDIDVVVIATPDHWHTRIAIDAMEAGKHIYVEKPMAH